MAGYSGTPLVRKLGIKPGARVLLVAAPPGFVVPDLPRDAVLHGRPGGAAYDVVVDGSDNFATRYAVADACAAEERPLVTASVGRFDGSLTVLMPYANDAGGRPNPSYRDLFPAPPPEGMVPSCAEAGVLGALTGVLGTLQAMEVIKLVTGVGEPLVGRLLLYDGLATRFETIRYRRHD